MLRYSGKLIYIVILFAVVNPSFAQSRKQKREIRKLQKKADAHFDFGDYMRAIDLYSEILRLDSNDNSANYKMGVSHYRIRRLRPLALRYFQKVHSAHYPESHYYLGLIYHHLHDFEKAIQSFKKYISFASEKEFDNAEVARLMDKCYTAMFLESHPVSYVAIENLGPSVNSPFPDYVPLIPADESFLIFTSRRESSTGRLKDPYGDYFEDVFISRFVKGKWQPASNIDTTVNMVGHDACTGLSADGERLLIYRTDQQLTGGDIYLSTFNGKSWERPELLPGEINKEGAVESSACFAPDGLTIFFSSNRPGGFGGKDIYMTKKLPDGKWGIPVNLGKSINTEYDEDAPFVHPNGNILFFSSKGHKNMGGFDVFKSSFSDAGVFSEAENLGFPLNTVDDDIFFVMNTQATRGYISSEREGGLGSLDLYLVSFGEQNLDLEVISSFLTDEEGKPVPHSEITVLEPVHHKVEGIYAPNHLTGKFVMILEPGKSYTLIIKAPGFETITTEFSNGAGGEKNFKLKRSKQQ